MILTPNIFLLITALLALFALSHSAVAQAWDWQLSAPFNLNRAVDVIDLDPDNHGRGVITRLNNRGVRTICYVSVGTLENYRDDVSQFPARVVGRTYADWPDERFLDIRALDVLLPLMKARFRKCRNLGFAAIEPDNLDVHDNPSGFPLTAADTVKYATKLAAIAHGMGMGIGQKNVPELTGKLLKTMDFAITESCWQDKWCDEVLPYTRAGKPIYDAEYSDRPINFGQACRETAALGISMILKDRDLTKKLNTCP